MQSQLNNESIKDFLPKVFELIKKADQFESDQMRYFALQAMGNAPAAFSSLSKIKLAIEENYLIDTFELKGWIAAGEAKKAEISIEANNAYTLTVKNVLELKKHKISDVYKEVMGRQGRRGITRIFVEAGEFWIKGTVAKSNLGYDFRGQMSTNLYPSITHNMTFYDMLFGK